MRALSAAVHAPPQLHLCFLPRLYQIAPVRTVTKPRAEKHQAILMDLRVAIGLGIPLLRIPLPSKVTATTSSRTLVASATPTRPSSRSSSSTSHLSSLAPSPPSNVVHPLSLFPFYIPLIHLSFFVVLSIKSFYRSCSQFQLLLSTSAHANLNLNRYVRLIALASTDLLLAVPLASFVLYSNVAVIGLNPWVSWVDTQSNFSRVVQVPGIHWRADPYNAASVETLRWATVACALLFFAYFGFADEVIKNYHWRNIQIPLLLLPRRIRDPPVFIRKDTTQKRNSFDLFSNMTASYGGISLLEYDAEKARVLGAGEYDDYKASDYLSSPTSSSASTDTESMGGEDGEI
ncbi:pheromone A receptor-domain-containing protein [Mycena leptocephala]|nr:pheromone A receptor-domain-containing protein [Mycena leptocephala]